MFNAVKLLSGFQLTSIFVLRPPRLKPITTCPPGGLCWGGHGEKVKGSSSFAQQPRQLAGMMWGPLGLCPRQRKACVTLGSCVVGAKLSRMRAWRLRNTWESSFSPVFCALLKTLVSLFLQNTSLGFS